MRIDKPLSQEQAKQGDLIPAGNYIFEVLEASDEISKAGNDMIKIKLRIFMPDGRERVLFDYLMEAFEYKLAHFFEAVGLWDKYSAGSVSADDCWGKSGECKVYIKKDKNGIYADQSAVADYLLSDTQQAAKHERKVAAVKQAAPVAKGADFDESDLPF